MANLFHNNPAPEPAATADIAAFVRVAVERGFDSPNAHPGSARLDFGPGLTYAVPESLDEPDAVTPGDRVRVPLGRSDTPAFGVVTDRGGPELLGDFPASKVKPIAARTQTRLPAALVELADWIARYYCCPLGMVFAGMVPAAVKQDTGRRTRRLLARTDAAAPETMTKSVRAAFDALTAIKPAEFPLDPAELKTRTGAANMGPLNRLIDAGVLAWIERDEVRASSELWDDAPAVADTARPPKLTDHQHTAVEGIGATLDSGDDAFGVHLLRGVTGSGKTEVYLRLIERVLAHGTGDAPAPGVIVLVPEIALTPQTGQRFVQRFGTARVAVLHSGLTASQRNRAWHRVAQGEATVVVGARSAVFAPVRALRLVIVDEEHDPSYKQDQLPRYHARDVAIKRAQTERAACVLGSATPSLESWHNATMPDARYRLWTLPTRATGAPPPNVEIVDLADERRRRAEGEHADPSPLITRDGLFADNIGPTLEAGLRSTLEAGGQAILLLNRRGFASHVACPSRTCGWSLSCDHCSAHLVLHRLGLRQGQNAPRGFLRCHHCQAEQLCPASCPVCGKRTVLVGSGTQRLEGELAARLGLEPGRDFVRVDGDTMNRAADYFAVLSRFAEGDLKVLLGTQMLAKGLDFPNVRLVGVINADTGLAIPDFRAAERTFQLVSQVAGRAGRAAGGEPGRVIVQTMSPDEPAIVLAAAHEFERFAAGELETRGLTGYPPAARMARIVTRDQKAEAAEAHAREIASAMRDLARSPEAAGLRIEGPMPCSVERISDHYRFEVRVIGPDAVGPQRAMGILRRAGLLLSDARTAVDVDPVSLM